MKAIAYTQHGLPPEDPRSLIDIALPEPVPGPRDLKVRVRAIAVNPVDTKVRRGAPTETPRVIGWDAVGVVEAVGPEVRFYRPGDEVFFAGAIDRPGCYAEAVLVDERIAGRKPRTLSDAEAAALPLTTITAWELLFDRLGIPEGGGAGQHLLVVGAADAGTRPAARGSGSRGRKDRRSRPVGTGRHAQSEERGIPPRRRPERRGRNDRVRPPDRARCDRGLPPELPPRGQPRRVQCRDHRRPAGR